MNRLAIVARAMGFANAPWHDRRYDCWTLNSAWQGMDLEDLPLRLTAWFELHSRRYLDEEWAHRKTHVRALAQLPIPVYVQTPSEWPELQHPTALPQTQLRRAFPRGRYHASSIDWMLAVALLKGYKHIDLYGVDLGPTEGREPLSARPCLEYWIGVAEGRGVKVVVHEPTALFWIYNYQRERTPYHMDDSWRLVEARRGQ